MIGETSTTNERVAAVLAATPVVLVGPRSGYGPGGTLFAELLGRGREIREIGLVPPEARSAEGRDGLKERIQAAVEDLASGPHSASAPALIGYSLGAAAAAQYAASSPGTVSSLVLSAGWVHPTGKMLAAARLWRSLQETGEPLRRREDALLAVRMLLVSSRGWPSMPEQQSVRLEPVAGADIAELLEGCADVDIEAAASRITEPTLVVAGSLDEFAGPAQSHLLFGAIRDARLSEIESGHALLIERPAELLDVVDSFIAEPRENPPGTRIAGRRP